MFLLLLLNLLANSPFDLRVYPCCSLPDRTPFRAYLHVPKHPNNRGVTLELDGGLYRFSQLNVDGERAAEQYSILYPPLDTGCYQFVAALWREENGRVKAVATEKRNIQVGMSCDFKKMPSSR